MICLDLAISPRTVEIYRANIMMRAPRRDRSEWDMLVKETMALTKINWNNTQCAGALPIIMRAARQIGEILKHVAEGHVPDPRYRFDM